MNSVAQSAPIICLSFFLSACPTYASDPVPLTEQSVEPAIVVGEPVAIARQFGTSLSEGCVAQGDTEELRGTIEMMELGRGLEGTVLSDGDVKWVISYETQGVFEDFEGAEVLARGRRCDKQGESAKAWHFEVRSIRVIE